MTAYKPIDCHSHSQLELHIMHQDRLSLEWLDEASIRHLSIVAAKDLLSIKGDGEYLIFDDESGHEHRLRLDKILSFTVKK